MTPLRLVLAGLRHYRRTHLGVLAGCAVSAAVFLGALFVGDSVRDSLGRVARSRLGRIRTALDSGDRYFRDDLASRLGGGSSAALRIEGMAIRDGKQVNRVDVVGVDGRFLDLADAPAGIFPKPDQVALGRKLAAALGAKAGDEIALRVFKPGLLPRDAPLASRKDKDTRRKLVTVAAVLNDDQLGRFSLRSDQAAPNVAFVDLKWLQEIVELDGRANLLVSAGDFASDALKRAWSLEDAGLALSPPSKGLSQLRSNRIYLDPSISSKALDIRRDGAGQIAYLVNSITATDGRSTPYSFVSAISPTADRALGPVPADMKHDEILVNRWLADQLGVKEGDKVTVAYSELLASNRFETQKVDFRVRGVLEMEAMAVERDLMPEFPGLTDVDSCKDWDSVLPLEEQQLKDVPNEKYWERYKQTPKAIVTLRAGQSMWANRYGDLMAVRWRAEAAKEAVDALRAALDPADAGLALRPAQAEASRAAAESMDLGQLFLGMSMFLIAASLILTSMLFIFSAEQRAREMGVLLAVGFPPGRVRRLFLAEGGVLAVLGSVAGLPLGAGFAALLVRGLGGEWSGAVGDAPISFHASPSSAAVGIVASAAVSLLAMALALRKQARRPVRELVAEDFSVKVDAPGSGRLRGALLAVGLLGAAGVAGWGFSKGAERAAPAFFGAGALMLVAAAAAARIGLARLSTRTSARLSAGELGTRNAARRPGRSLATAAMLACGCFVVFAVSAMKEDLLLQSGERASGTGGFRLYAESSIAVSHDLNSPKGRDAYRLTDAEAMSGVTFTPARVREGDDASCLNLNAAARPTLLGVDPAAMAALGAFGADWGLLDGADRDGAVPALVGDSATAMWKLRKKVGAAGDVYDYVDESGRPFQVRLVGALPPRLSVLQGRLVVSNKHLTRLYPSEGGSRVFLIDVPAGAEGKVASYLAERMDTAGMDAVRSTDRLKEFYAVESAYLRMFLVLGGMGLLLGTAGMGVLVLRNVMERRGELALLRATGWSGSAISRMVAQEHWVLLGAGLGAGLIAAGLAVGPALARPEAQVPVGLLAGFLVGTVALSLAWIRLATVWALRAPLTPALRRE